MRTLIIVAMLLSLSACSPGARYKDTQITLQIAGTSSQLADMQATAKVEPEIVRLKIVKPIRKVEVVVLDSKLYGWWDHVARRIYIVNRGYPQNVKTLRHEWEHARQLEAGEPYDERKAYNAELEEP
jgi:hypothetical protein